ncbi:MAG: biopolymer transporter ExbD [Elusimicrobiales bacterium]|nr:biopolymer transporter ExbD [Elusimicrobiales bacterium]
MAFQTGEETDSITGINVTPLVDVCLVLVIIFMVATPLMVEPKFAVKLPVAKTKDGEAKEKIEVSIASDGRLALFQKDYAALSAMQPDLKKAIDRSDTKYVIFRADRESRYGLLAELMQAAKEAGAVDMIIATEQRK